MKQGHNKAVISVAVSAITVAISFLFIGWSPYNAYQDRDTAVVTGEWVSAREIIHESNFACPESGELVGNVWESDGVWKARTESAKDSWQRLANDFKDEEHAKSAAEKFIRKYKVCSKN